MVAETEPMKNPFLDSNQISKALHCWCWGFFSKLNGPGINIDELFIPRQEEQCKLITENLQERIYGGKSYHHLNLRLVISWFAKRVEFIQWFLVACVSSVVLRVLATVTLIYSLTELALNDPTDFYYLIAMLTIAIFLFLLMLIITFMEHMRHFWGKCYGDRIRIGITGAIYYKITKVPTRILNEEKMSSLIELMLSDILILKELPLVLQETIISIPILLVGITLLNIYAGFAGLLGVIVYLALAVPIHIIAACATRKHERILKSKRATTLTILSDVLHGIDTIKTACLSDVFIRILQRAYKREARFSKHLAMSRIIPWIGAIIWYRLGSICTITVYLLQGNILTLGQLMMIFILYEHYCTHFMSNFGEAIRVFTRSSEVISVVNDFLRVSEQRHNLRTEINTWEIQFINVTVQSSHGQAALNNINMIIPMSKLTVICGSVLSGCSSIIPILSDDILIQSGEIKMGGVMSYYFKKGVLLEGSIKNNIILSSKYERHHYQSIVKLCGLYSEIHRIDGGDERYMSVGEYWPSLQSKVLLARTLYTIANIYIFQQPPVQIVNSRERLIFEDCITKYLRGITRLVISNQFVYLKQADVVYYFENGQIKGKGTYDQLRRRSPDINLIVKHGTDDAAESIHTRNSLPIKRAQIQNIVRKSSQHIKRKELYLISLIRTPHRALKEILRRRKDQFAFLILFLSMLLSGSLPLVARHYLFVWSTSQLQANFSQYKGVIRYSKIRDMNYRIKYPISKVLDILEFRIYILIALCMIPFVSIQYAIVVRRCFRHVRRMYHKLLENILKKNILYFSNISLMSINELLTKDIYIIQENLPLSYIKIAEGGAAILSAFILFAYLDYYLAPALLVYLFVGVYMMVWLKKTCNRLLILEEEIKHPILVHIKSTQYLLGMLRCSELVENHISSFYTLVNKHTTCIFMITALIEAFRTWVTLLAIFLAMIMVAVYAFEYVYYKKYYPSINIIVYYTCSTIIFVNLGITNLLNAMFLNHHITQIAAHNDLDYEDTESGLRYPKIWIEPPAIHFFNLRGPPFSLTKVDFKYLRIGSGEHVGLVGRPGSGRRLLVKMLLRLYPNAGIIKLNHRNIEMINICTLRRNIFYLSVDSALFAPTIRFNLDPRNEFTDSTLWKALNTIGNTSYITSLEQEVEAKGHNIIMDQKILILLARALLLRSKILILDRVFETVSNKLQNEIEDMLFTTFEKCTLIIIESRLNYLTRCHRIVILDNGRLMDDNSPTEVYKNPNNFMHTIVDKIGYISNRKLSLMGVILSNADINYNSVEDESSGTSTASKT